MADIKSGKGATERPTSSVMLANRRAGKWHERIWDAQQIPSGTRLEGKCIRLTQRATQAHAKVGRRSHDDVAMSSLDRYVPESALSLQEKNLEHGVVGGHRGKNLACEEARNLHVQAQAGSRLEI
jgi:hypothetical protein